jgi:hypothetical protein
MRVWLTLALLPLALAACHGPASVHPHAEVAIDDIGLLQQLIDTTPATSPERPELDFRLAVALDKRAASAVGSERDAACDRALAVYRAILDESGWRTYRRRDELLFWYAQGLANRGRGDASIAELERLVAEYPSSKLVLPARLAIAEQQHAGGDAAAAVSGYRLVASSGRGELARYARYRLAWAYFGLGDIASATAELVTVARMPGEDSVAQKLTASARADLVVMLAGRDPPDTLVNVRTLLAAAAADDPAVANDLLTALAREYCAQGKTDACTETQGALRRER